MKLEEGKNYDLYSVDIATDSSGRDYIEAYDQNDNLFKIYNLLNCQRIELPKTIRCIAIPHPKSKELFLVQDKAYYYRKAYDEGHFYQFTVKDIVIEGNKHYLIEDDVDIHYFPFSDEPQYKIGDDIILEVKEITDKGKIIFHWPKSNTQKQEHKSEIFEKEKETDSQSAAKAPVLSLPQEDFTLELKTSLAYSSDGNCDIAKQSYNIIRVLASFMNTQGGTLYIGIHDSTHKVLGIEKDFEHLNDNPDDAFEYKQDVDGYQNLIRNRLSALCQGFAQQLIKFEFPNEQGITYCKITVEKAHRPIWVSGNQLWVRSGNSTRQLRGDDISFFIGLYDIFEKGDDNRMTQEEAQEAMYKVLNRDFAKTDIQHLSGNISYYITWYRNCSYRKTKNEETGTDVLYSLPVYDSVKKGGGVVLFCYDNGRVNKVDISVLMKGMNLNSKPKNRAFFTGATLLDIYITLPSNILAVLSKDQHGTQNAKAHEITHIGSTQGGGNQGSTFVPSPCINLQYKLIDATNRNEIKHLIFAKNQTSQTAGFPTNSPSYKDEIDKLLNL